MTYYLQGKVKKLYLLTLSGQSQLFRYTCCAKKSVARCRKTLILISLFPGHIVYAVANLVSNSIHYVTRKQTDQYVVDYKVLTV